MLYAAARCLLNAGYPAVSGNLNDATQMDVMRQMIALQKPVALLGDDQP